MSGQWLVWWSMAGFTERRKGINWTLDRHGASTKYPSSPVIVEKKIAKKESNTIYNVNCPNDKVERT